MPRSLRVDKKYMPQVKSALRNKGYSRQIDLAADLDCSLTTVSSFLNGRAVDRQYFMAICKILGQDCQKIAALEDSSEGDETEASIYVKRPELEERCYQELLKPGAVLRVKAPKRLGKTSLIMRVIQQLEQEQDYRGAYLPFGLADKTELKDLDKLLKWFCVSAGQALGLDNELNTYWDEKYSTSKMNCTNYFEAYLLTQLSDSPVVLCLDDVDLVFPYQEVAQDFLEMLRAWHEKSKISKIWKRLRLVLVHSTDVYIRLDTNASPFNVGLTIGLPKLTLEQVEDLINQHNLELEQEQLEKLTNLVGGHPYLLHEALNHLKNNKTSSLEQLLAEATTEAGIYSSHLRSYWSIIRQNYELANALKTLVKSNQPVELKPKLKQFDYLYCLGLADFKGNEVKISCNLYKEYFKERIDGILEST
ncbi:MAG: molecular chaperone Tir [Symploca sp. SIO2D2]|nr:molecular chaperone Tir [Symploca sp. SIO2D2]